MTDKEMVKTYFDTLSLYELIYEDGVLMDLSLLRRPKRIKSNTQTLYIYAPSIVSSGLGLEPGTVVRVLDVYEGSNYEETTLRVMTEDTYSVHKYNVGCTRYKYPSNECDCKLPTEQMPDRLKSNVFHILLSDLGV